MGIEHVQLVQVFRGVMPFLAVFLLDVFPALALWLPQPAYG